MTTLGGPAGEPARVTIYDVAQRAGVSIATVSHSLNRPNKVSQSTRERVLKVVDEMRFVPKEVAVSRARKGVGRIGVLAPFSSHASYRERLAGVLTAAAGDAIEVVVFDHFNVAEAASPLLHSLPTAGRIDGLILMGVPLEETLADRLQQRRISTVLVDSSFPGFSSVNIDDEYGGRVLATHLVERGATSFAFVSEPQRSLEYRSAGQARFAGFRAALVERGADLAESRWLTTSNNVDGGREAVERALALDPAPNAVFAHRDGLAAGILRGLRNAGQSVPDQVKVAGYDGGEVAEALDLTTVKQPFVETGRIAATLLVQSLAAPGAAAQRVSLLPELVVGSTT